MMNFYIDIGTKRSSILAVAAGSPAKLLPLPIREIGRLGRGGPDRTVIPSRAGSLDDAQEYLDAWAVAEGGFSAHFGLFQSGYITHRVDSGEDLFLVCTYDQRINPDTARAAFFPPKSQTGQYLKRNTKALREFFLGLEWFGDSTIACIGTSHNDEQLKDALPGNNIKFIPEGIATLLGFLDISMRNTSIGAGLDWVDDPGSDKAKPINGYYLSLDLGGGSLDCSLIKWDNSQKPKIVQLWNKGYEIGAENAVKHARGNEYDFYKNEDLVKIIKGPEIEDYLALVLGLSRKIIEAASNYVKTANEADKSDLCLRVLFSGKAWTLTEITGENELLTDEYISFNNNKIDTTWAKKIDTKFTTVVGLLRGVDYMKKVDPPFLTLEPDAKGDLGFWAVKKLPGSLSIKPPVGVAPPPPSGVNIPGVEQGVIPINQSRKDWEKDLIAAYLRALSD